MEASVEIEECLAERPYAVVLAAGTGCIVPSFPGPGRVSPLVTYPFEVRFGGEAQLLSIPEPETLEREPIATAWSASPVEAYLEGLIAHLAMPRSWIDEQVEGPNENCKRYALEVVRRLFATYGIIPYKITISKEGGIFAAYKNPHNNRILRIEVDNDLDVVAVVSDVEAVLDSGLLEADDIERSLLRSFDPQLARAFSLPGAPGSLSF